MESQTGDASMGGGHATEEENCQEEGGAPTTTSSSSRSSLGPHTKVKGTPQTRPNRNDNSGLNSEPQMPPSLMGYWHTTKRQGFSGTAWKRGWGAGDSLELPHCPPTGAPQTLPGGCSAPVSPPLRHCRARPHPFSHLPPLAVPAARQRQGLSSAGAGAERAASTDSACNPEHPPKPPEPSAPACTPRPATLVPF